MSIIQETILNAEAKKLGIDPDVYKSMSPGRRQAAQNAYYFKTEMARIQAEDRARNNGVSKTIAFYPEPPKSTTQQAAAVEPVEAVPVQVVTRAPARSKWIYIAIGAAVAWLIFGRR